MSNIQYYIINGHLVWKGRLNKINNQKVDNPPSFILRPLNYNDIDAMGKLSHQIYQHLQAGEECFIHKHDKQYYSKAINQKDLHYFGIFRGTQLVGMSYLRICRTPEEFAEEIPGCREQFFTSSKTTIAALGADSVLPEYRGNSLNKIMIAKLIASHDKDLLENNELLIERIETYDCLEDEIYKILNSERDFSRNMTEKVREVLNGNSINIKAQNVNIEEDIR